MDCKHCGKPIVRAMFPQPVWGHVVEGSFVAVLRCDYGKTLAGPGEDK